MIVTAHVASGALAGVLAGSRLRALALAPLLHVVLDVVPHEDLRSHAFEAGSGGGAILLLAATRGLLDPATLGGLASSLPDVEHRLDLPRPAGRKLFPSHRWGGGHTRRWVPAWAQLLVAGAILGDLLSARWRS